LAEPVDAVFSKALGAIGGLACAIRRLLRSAGFLIRSRSG